jgi:hypothetical protein
VTRVCLSLLACLSLASVAAADDAVRTPNFVVHAPNREVAVLVGKQAEAARKTQAMQWLGYEMRPWKRPCDLHVKLAPGLAEGVTTTRFDGDWVFRHDMEIKGARERFPSVLAHELTHTVLAHALGKPVPRWADEGAAVLSEEKSVTDRLDGVFEQMLKKRGQIVPLQRLFTMTDYPDDRAGFYAQASSVTRFLLERKDRVTFVAFLRTADGKGWDIALRKHYDIRRVSELEKAWLADQRGRAEKRISAEGSKP